METKNNIYFLINEPEKQWVLGKISENQQFRVKILGEDPEAYLRSFQTSMMKLFCVNSQRRLAIFFFAKKLSLMLYRVQNITMRSVKFLVSTLCVNGNISVTYLTLYRNQLIDVQRNYRLVFAELKFSSSKSPIETLEKGVKYVQN